MPDAVIVTKDLQKTYGKVNAVGPLTTEVPAGCWGLLGPNGAGKTTLIKLLLGLTSATNGRATVLGLDPQRQARAVRERIGFAPEATAEVPGLTGFQYVTLAARLCGLPKADAKQRAHEVLDFVGLTESRYRPTAQYSQGMHQRIKLAQAIVHDPALVFLDEPTNGLDPDGREEMLALVRALARDRGIAVLLASHVLPEIESTCDGAIVLDQGRVVASNTMATLAGTKRSTYVMGLRGDARPLVAMLRAKGAACTWTPDGELLVRVPDRVTPRHLLAQALKAGVEVRKLAPARDTLEDTMLTALQDGGG